MPTVFNLVLAIAAMAVLAELGGGIRLGDDNEASDFHNQSSVTKVSGPWKDQVFSKKQSCIKYITFDFDGTIEQTDDLAKIVNNKWPEADEKLKQSDSNNNDPKLCTEEAQEQATKKESLLNRYKEEKQKDGGLKQIKSYFSEDINSGEEGLAAVAKIIGETNMYINSASWCPTSAAGWKKYLTVVTKDMKLDKYFPENRILTSIDLGKGTSSDKPGAIKKANLAVENVLHVDNSKKHCVKVADAGGLGYHVNPDGLKVEDMRAIVKKLKEKKCPT